MNDTKTKWPFTIIKNETNTLVSSILDTLNTILTEEKPFGSICNLIDLSDKNKATFYTKVPTKYVTKETFHQMKSCLSITLEFKKQENQQPNNKLNLLHPVIRYIQFDKNKHPKIQTLHLSNPISGAWENKNHHILPLLKFLSENVNRKPIFDATPKVVLHPPFKQILERKKLAAIKLYPLTEAQKEQWFTYKLEPNNPKYNISCSLQLKGSLDTSRLMDAIYKTIFSLDLLKVSFKLNNKTPTLFLKKPMPIIKEKNISALKITEQSTILRQEIETPFNLLTQHPYRFSLFQKTKSSFILSLVMHHIISDIFTLDKVIKTVLDHYNNPQLLESDLNKDVFIHDSPIIYNKIDSKNYWNTYLKNSPAPTTLQDYSHNKKGPSGNTQLTSINKKLSLSIREYCKKESIKPFTFLITTFQVLLARYTFEDSVILGVPMTTRTKNTPNKLGFYVNTVPFYSSLKNKQSFKSLLKENQATLKNCISHRFLPHQQIIAAKKKVLFEHLFVYQNKRYPLPKVKNITLKQLFPKRTTFTHNFTCVLWDTSSITIQIEYNQTLYSNKFVKNFLQHYKNLLENFVKTPTLPLAKQATTTLTEFSKTSTEPEDLLSLFQKIVSKHPNKIALKTSSKASITYKVLNKQSTTIMQYLLSKHANKKIIGLHMSKSIYLVSAIIGVLKANKAFVLINPTLPIKRKETIMSLSKSSTLITQNPIPLNQAKQTLLIENILAFSNKKALLPPIQKKIAYIIFTSGSTGTPKGIKISRQGLSNYIFSRVESLSFTSKDTTIVIPSITFDGFLATLFSGILVGSKTVLVDLDHDSLTKITRLLKTEKITQFSITPSLLKELCHTHEADLRHLKKLILAGESYDKIWVDQLRLNYPRLKVYNEYGPAETNIGTSEKEHKTNTLFNNIGKPFNNMNMIILAKDMSIVDAYIPGNIYITGKYINKNYLSKTNNNESYVPNPHNPQTIMYKTGDIGFFDHHNDLHFLGREINYTKINGMRVDLQEIKNALNKALKQQTTNPDSEIFIENNQIIAAIQCKTLLNISKIRQTLSSEIPLEMIPSQFIVMPQLPTTIQGKLDTKTILKSTHPQKKNHDPPKTTISKKLKTIWSTYIDTTNISIHDSFFERGGTSLNSLQIIADIEETFKTPISLSDFRLNPSIESLEKSIKKRQPTQAFIAIQKKLTPPPKNLVFLHPIGGFTYCYDSLADQCPYDLISVNSPLINPKKLFKTFDELTTYYTQKLHPLLKKDFIICGWSFGGILAYELSKKLIQKNHNPTLILIDSLLSRNSTDQVHISFIKDIENTYKCTLSDLYATKMPTNKIETTDFLLNLQKKTQQLSLAIGDLKFSIFSKLYSIFSTHLTYINHYKPTEKINCSCIHYLSTQSIKINPTGNQWRQLVQELNEVIVEAHHYNILEKITPKLLEKLSKLMSNKPLVH